MFGWFKKKRDLRLVIITAEEDSMDDTYHQRLSEMREKQEQLMEKMGFVHGDDHHNWLRLHEILFDHEGRIRSIELGKALKDVKK